MSQKWKGPYYIHEIIGKGAYKLRTLEGKVLRSSYNVKHLKEYFDQGDKLPLIFVWNGVTKWEIGRRLEDIIENLDIRILMGHVIY